MEINVRLQVLFDKYINQTISSEELSELDQYVRSDVYSALWKEVLEAHYQTHQHNIPEDLLIKAKPIADHSWARIQHEIKGKKKLWMQGIYRYTAAAILILSMSGIWYYLTSQNSSNTEQLTSIDDIFPGGNRATLSFGNGQQIALSESQNELVINSDGIVYGDGSTLATETEATDIATIRTPKGGQYQITLPDGTKVWLNASSTLRYTVRAQGKTRRVELQGEAYFDVQSISSKQGAEQKIPFIVATAGQEIHVLGTEFNVMAYADENTTKTTLIEGKVRINTPSGQQMDLHPGTQAVLDKQGLSKHTVKTEDFTTWKDGVIVLQQQSMKQIFKELERWYDVEFVTEDGVKLSTKTLSGNVMRDLPLSALLQTLEDQTQHQFERKGRRIMVR